MIFSFVKKYWKNHKMYWIILLPDPVSAMTNETRVELLIGKLIFFSLNFLSFLIFDTWFSSAIIVLQAFITPSYYTTALVQCASRVGSFKFNETIRLCLRYGDLYTHADNMREAYEHIIWNSCSLAYPRLIWFNWESDRHCGFLPRIRPMFKRERYNIVFDQGLMAFSGTFLSVYFFFASQSAADFLNFF